MATRNQRDEHALAGTGKVVANGTAYAGLTLGSGTDGGKLAPAGVTTSTVSQWLRIEVAGTEYYIPMWT